MSTCAILLIDIHSFTSVPSEPLVCCHCWPNWWTGTDRSDRDHWGCFQICCWILSWDVDANCGSWTPQPGSLTCDEDDIVSCKHLLVLAADICHHNECNFWVHSGGWASRWTGLIPSLQSSTYRKTRSRDVVEWTTDQQNLKLLNMYFFCT
jgi:hypothetical protein